MTTKNFSETDDLIVQQGDNNNFENNFEETFRSIINENESIRSPDVIPIFVQLMNSVESRDHRMSLLISLFSSDSTIFLPFVIQYNGIRNMKFWMSKSISEKDFSSQLLLLRLLQKLPVSAEGIILSGISEVLKLMSRSENKDIVERSIHLLKVYKNMIDEEETTEQEESSTSNKKRSYEDTVDSSTHTDENAMKRKKEKESASEEIMETQKPKKPKKSLRWAPDDELEQIKIFEKEKSVTGIDFRTTLANELVNEKEQLYIKRRKEIEEWKLKKDNMLENIKWTTPLAIDFEEMNNSLKLRQQRAETPEQKVQTEREEGTLMAIYLSELDIPYSPAEPDKRNSNPTYDDMSILILPSERIQQPIPIPNIQQPILNLGQFLTGFNNQPNLLNTQQMYLQNPINNQQKGYNMSKIPPNNPLFVPNFFNNPNTMKQPQPNTIPLGMQGNINFNNFHQSLNVPENVNQETKRFGDYEIIKTMYNINHLKSPADLKKFECRFYPKGRCEYGSLCKYLHLDPIRGTR